MLKKRKYKNHIMVKYNKKINRNIRVANIILLKSKIVICEISAGQSASRATG